MNRTEIIASDAITDNELITRIIQGEKNLYAVIVRRYNQRLYRIGMSVINDDAEVEDIMQVTYINAYENLGKFAFKASFSTWLIKILINESLLRLKKNARSVNLNEQTMDRQIHDYTTNKVPTPVTKALNAELKSILETSIRQLPEKYRTIFIMREIEGLNIAETQECLNITEANVKVRLSRAKVLLKNSLSAYYKDEDILHFHLNRCDKMVNYVLTKI